MWKSVFPSRQPSWSTGWLEPAVTLQRSVKTTLKGKWNQSKIKRRWRCFDLILCLLQLWTSDKKNVIDNVINVISCDRVLQCILCVSYIDENNLRLVKRSQKKSLQVIKPMSVQPREVNLQSTECRNQSVNEENVQKKMLDSSLHIQPSRKKRELLMANSTAFKYTMWANPDYKWQRDEINICAHL